MIPPVSHPSESVLKELQAIAVQAAQDAIANGWSTSTFHGYQIHACSWSINDNTQLLITVRDLPVLRLLAFARATASTSTSCTHGSERHQQKRTALHWDSLAFDAMRGIDSHACTGI